MNAAGLVIEIQVDVETTADAELAAALVDVCPVDIFARDADGRLEIALENVDECTLCELCLSVGPAGSVRVLKLYDEDRPLGRSI